MNVQPLPVKRAAAIAMGYKIYQTEKPCSKGHNSPRYARGGTCLECIEEKKASLRRKEPKKAGLPKTWAEAKKSGSPRYFTGIPCKSGHVAERVTGNGGCSVCMKLRNRSPVTKRSNSAKMVLGERILSESKHAITIDELIRRLSSYKPAFVKYEIDFMLRNGAALERLKDGTIQSKMVIDDAGRPVFGKSRNMTWFNDALAGARNRLGVG